MKTEGRLSVQVVYALPDQVWRVRLDLPEGSTVADALGPAAAQLAEANAEIDPDRLAVFSRPVGLATALRDGDRLEILRPLAADPKQSRRNRAKENLPGKR